jgi:hypothetical protein
MVAHLSDTWWRCSNPQQSNDCHLTATSRRVEAVFGTLKQLERTHAKLGLRRIFVVATSSYNQTVGWLDEQSDARQDEITLLAIKERAGNETAAKALEKSDREKF